MRRVLTDSVVVHQSLLFHAMQSDSMGLTVFRSQCSLALLLTSRDTESRWAQTSRSTECLSHRYVRRAPGYLLSQSLLYGLWPLHGAPSEPACPAQCSPALASEILWRNLPVGAQPQVYRYVPAAWIRSSLQHILCAGQSAPRGGPASARSSVLYAKGSFCAIL
jgi:hypothetical protein